MFVMIFQNLYKILQYLSQNPVEKSGASLFLVFPVLLCFALTSLGSLLDFSELSRFYRGKRQVAGFN